MNNFAEDVQLLECTLRDGSYAVDFRFTNEDTALICGFFSKLGFKFIEIGHGLGINASNAGKGKMPSTDDKLLEIAKSASKNSMVGMFCIPGIATLENLAIMSEAGMDFVRIGINAEDFSDAFPYIETARKHNLYTMVNFMKTYTISPKKFARNAKESVDIGAQVIYIVDSAGGMLPNEIIEYIGEIKQLTDIKIGLHGHNNLQLATANAIEAVRNGANFIDTTLYGIGRSAGNVPTEIMLAILNNMGINIGIDLFELMDFADTHFSPLMSNILMHDMLSVAMGAGKFHSSFFPMAKKVADEHKVDVRKLIYRMGKKNLSKVEEKDLLEIAMNLEPHDQGKLYFDMTSFYSPKNEYNYISTTLYAVSELLDGLLNVASKSRKKIIVEVLPTANLNDNLVLTEYVTTDPYMVMGRVCFGSLKMLESVLELIEPYISFLMIDVDSVAKGKWIDLSDLFMMAASHFDRSKIVVVRSNEIKDLYLKEAIRLASVRHGRNGLLIYGGDTSIYSTLKSCFNEFDSVFCFKPRFEYHDTFSGIAVLDNLHDWKELNLVADVILCASIPTNDDLKILIRIAGENGIILSIVPQRLFSTTSKERKTLVFLDLKAYHCSGST